MGHLIIVQVQGDSPSCNSTCSAFLFSNRHHINMCMYVYNVQEPSLYTYMYCKHELVRYYIYNFIVLYPLSFMTVNS
jgi:hypothetical protein